MDHDSAWKEVLEKLFKEFLDKELHKIVASSATGARVVDKLVKVYLKEIIHS